MFSILILRPIAVSIDASSALQSYAGGIFDGACTTSRKIKFFLNNAILNQTELNFNKNIFKPTTLS